jgi:ligand-binding sensor domain-containing protein
MINKKRLTKILSNLFSLMLSAVLFCSNLANAQSKPVIFDRFNTRDGLSQNKIFDIVQDTLGFIWIGTEDGLNRYDGYEFKVYKNDPNDIGSLSNNMIETMHVTKNGDLWLGGNLGGLSKFDFNTETFTNFLHDHSDINTIIGNNITDISEDEKGNLWIATYDQGFDYMDVKTNSFFHMANILPAGYEINTEFIP